MKTDQTVRIGVIICHRYHRCAGGKCFRALHERQGAFSLYRNKEATIVGFVSCGGCPGGNVEYAPEEMLKNGATVIHLATGLIVGYPPCPRIGYFHDFIQSRFGMEVIFGTHPVPQKYYEAHKKMNTWATPFWKEAVKLVLTRQEDRRAYD